MLGQLCQQPWSWGIAAGAVQDPSQCRMCPHAGCVPVLDETLQPAKVPELPFLLRETPLGHLVQEGDFGGAALPASLSSAVCPVCT